jgi:adenylate cyclase
MMSTLGYFYAVSGRPEVARKLASEFEEIARGGRYASAYAEAAIWAGLGDKDRAMALLDRSFEEHSHWLLWLKRDPRWTSLRPDPRFQALVRKVGLPA